METKKSVKASLENKRILFLEVGLVLALALVWAGFSWETREAQEAKMKNEAKMEDEFEQDEVMLEEEKKPDIPPPPEEEQQEEEFSDEIEEIEDDEEESVRVIEEDADVEIKRVERQENIEVEEEEEEVETVEFFRVEVKPTFQGGDPNAFSKWVAQHLQYPEIAKENGIKGRVILQFTIGADGKLTDIKVVRGVDKALDDEAVRVVKSSPKWTPGRQRDRAVKVTYTFPVIFDLR